MSRFQKKTALAANLTGLRQDCIGATGRLACPYPLMPDKALFFFNQWRNDYYPVNRYEQPASILHDSALAWAKITYQTDQVVAIIILEEGDEPGRYLALIAAANQAAWQAAEVWLEDGRVVAINDLGEGMPPDGATWPW